MDWISLIQTVQDEEKKYLDKINKFSEKKYTNLREALLDITKGQRKDANYFQEIVGKEEMVGIVDAIYSDIWNSSYSHYHILPHILEESLSGWKAYHNNQRVNSQKIIQLEKAKTDVERAGYIDEIDIAKMTIGRLHDNGVKKFTVDVKNKKDKADFTIFIGIEGKDLNTMSFEEALKLYGLPFDAKKDLDYFSLKKGDSPGKRFWQDFFKDDNAILMIQRLGDYIGYKDDIFSSDEEREMEELNVRPESSYDIEIFGSLNKELLLYKEIFRIFGNMKNYPIFISSDNETHSRVRIKLLSEVLADHKHISMNSDSKTLYNERLIKEDSKEKFKKTLIDEIDKMQVKFNLWYGQ